jgi:hypothetical protein
VSHWQDPSASDQTTSQRTLHKTHNPLQTILRLSFRCFVALLVLPILRHFFVISWGDDAWKQGPKPKTWLHAALGMVSNLLIVACRQFTRAMHPSH